ncbi:MAG TPA: DegT/DnrJ/EryC1/StrS family aminotransferase [Pirellula sp.]|nr:DegT/DnrJ/EryC1/StrS family aminotransferase [Pirellula sp.]
MQSSIDRRQMIKSAAVGGVASCIGTASAHALPSPVPSSLVEADKAAVKAKVEWPFWDSLEESGLRDVLNSGIWGRTSGGRRVPEFEAAFASRMKARYCIATTSGTSALLTTLGALGIGPGDEVIMPPYTFVATFNAITNSYALPVFVDTDAESFQIDAKKIESAMTANTKLLLPVHIGGSVFDLDAVNSIAKARNIPLIEDACQAPLAEWRGQPIGSIGLAGCFSFQASKNITSGEGGAVLTNDEQFANLCYNFHTPAGGKSGPSLGRGSNFRITEFQAALLVAQLSRLEEQSKIRDANAAYLTELLQKIPGIAPAKLAKGSTRSAWHLYMFRYNPKQFANMPRTTFLKELGNAGIAASSGYSRLNQSAHVRALATNPHYQRIYGKDFMTRWLEANQCPVNDQLCEEAIWFTQTKLLGTRANMEQIASTIASIQKRAV